MIKPVKPNEVAGLRTFPDEVIEAFNEMIVSNWKQNKTASFKQDDVMTLVIEKAKNKGEERSRSYYFDHGYFDIEDLYRADGWEVEYDKPAYCEFHAATFKFSK